MNPEFRFIPHVIEFLGYNPIPCPDEVMERLGWYKYVNGLTWAQLGAEMGRDPEQLSDWLSGRPKPFWRKLKKIELFLSGHSQGPGAVQRSGAALPEESAAASGPIKSLTEMTTSEKDIGT